MLSLPQLEREQRQGCYWHVTIRARIVSGLLLPQLERGQRQCCLLPQLERGQRYCQN